MRYNNIGNSDCDYVKEDKGKKHENRDGIGSAKKKTCDKCIFLLLLVTLISSGGNFSAVACALIAADDGTRSASK